ncbi:tetratricopeptide repeat protein [Thalassovita mediterranea]|uniref:Putative PEP-CTERM system TPR-repeat lipoprotein n=1 Tax=Thalassovita mediterranea TaxID=340021 RepID=A0A0P1GNE6_9RHOB|nr:tetratricopeptide repeat protein [Thalassovita mediterranea]CUH83999.1 putative PEP-CTERM system TPR-repeat lipoprotein [Thalassovita mediterranea]SIS27929.1 Tetratricopeptide repeat-containing protein [Thalassovita mediterranea]
MTRHSGASAALVMGLCALTLTACSTGGFAPSEEQVFAPGVDRSGDAVDGLIVGGRLMDAGEYELALDAYTRAALDHGLSVDVLAGLGSANLALGRLGQSEELLRRAVAKPDASPEVWNNLGVLLLEKGEIGEAQLVLRKAFALDNGASDAIRDNLRKALAKTENAVYDASQQQENYKLVRRGSSDYLIRAIP